MPTTPNLKPVLLFLDELSQNNQRAWFAEHRPEYETAREVFEQFINQIIDEFREPDHLQGLSARDCIARIYRDIRFSKDKSPYKTNLSANIAPGGWKANSFGYYISLQPHDGSMVAGGLREPAPEQLSRFRQAIDRDAEDFKRVTSAADFIKAFGRLEGERLKTAPRGYDPAHPEIDLLRLKQITAVQRFSDGEVLAEDFTERVVMACRAMRPFLDYMNDIIQ